MIFGVAVTLHRFSCSHAIFLRNSDLHCVILLIFHIFWVHYNGTSHFIYSFMFLLLVVFKLSLHDIKGMLSIKRLCEYRILLYRRSLQNLVTFWVACVQTIPTSWAVLIVGFYDPQYVSIIGLMTLEDVPTIQICTSFIVIACNILFVFCVTSCCYFLTSKYI